MKNLKGPKQSRVSGWQTCFDDVCSASRTDWESDSHGCHSPSSCIFPLNVLMTYNLMIMEYMMKRTIKAYSRRKWQNCSNRFRDVTIPLIHLYSPKWSSADLITGLLVILVLSVMIISGYRENWFYGFNVNLSSFYPYLFSLHRWTLFKCILCITLFRIGQSLTKWDSRDLWYKLIVVTYFVPLPAHSYCWFGWLVLGKRNQRDCPR